MEDNDYAQEENGDEAENALWFFRVGKRNVQLIKSSEIHVKNFLLKALETFFSH